MKAKDIIQKSDTDLATLLKEKREALRAIRFGTAGSAMRNVKESKNLKKDIARILTETAGRGKTKAS